MGPMVLDDHFFSAPVGTSMMYHQIRQRRKPAYTADGFDESDGAMMDEDETDGGWGIQNL